MRGTLKKHEKGANIMNRGFWNYKKVTAIVVIVAVAAAVSVGAFRSKRGAKSVNVETAGDKNLIQSISATGNIEAGHEYKISLAVTKKVEAVMVKEGDKVQKGAPLIRMDTSDLDYQLQKAKMNLQDAVKNYNAGMDAAEDAVKQARISYNGALRSLDNAKSQLNSAQSLYEKGAMSQKDYDALKNAVSSAEDSLEIAGIQYDASRRTLLNYSKSSQAKQQVDLLKVDVDNLNKKIKDCTINSEIGGKVVKMDAKVGQYPEAGDSILVCDISSYKFTTSLNQFDAVKVKPGQKVTIKIKGLDKVYTGVVARVGDMANSVVNGTSTETRVDVDITIDNPDSSIKVGYEADAEILLIEKKGVTAVSFDSIKEDNGGKYIFVARDGKAVKRYVKTGMETDLDVEITEGLSTGEKYITTPPDDLKDGDLILLPGVGKK